MQTDEAFYAYYEYRDEIMREALSDIASGVETQPWRLIDPERIRPAWEYYADHGFVLPRHTKAIEKAREIALENITKLDVNTELCGHTPSMDWDTIADYGIGEDELQETPYFDAGISWRISDYATHKLVPLAMDLMRAMTAEDTLCTIDRILNVVHQRSDLPAWFVMGGRAALDELSKGEFDE